VCTGHCTVQCPVHRQSRAKSQFSCALSGGSPDSYCALSGVHRTGTVDCPVRTYRVLKNGLQPDRARDLLYFPANRLLLSVSGVSSPAPAISTGGHLLPPGSGDLARALPLGEQLLSFPLSPCSRFEGLCGILFTTPLCKIQIPVKSGDFLLWNVFLCMP
jgi:hypothetical protein